MSTRRLNTLFRNAGPTQHRLLHKAERLRLLQGQLLALLPPEVAPHVQIANLRGSRLVLSTDGNAWATRLRYLSADLLRQLRSAGWSCQRIDVKVAANYAPPPAPRVQRHVSPAAQRLLRQTARHIDDPELAASLEKLARHSEPDEPS